MPVLHDAVTLRHFAAAGRMDVLERRHGELAAPRWTQAVFSELWEAKDLGFDECETVLEQTWLGSVESPADIAEQLAIQRLRVALGGSSAGLEHAGEAESIFFAAKHNGAVATDDGSAYDFAQRRLGTERVVDTVDILRSGVQLDELSSQDAADICEAIRDAGRHLRAVHPNGMGAAYFDS